MTGGGDFVRRFEPGEKDLVLGEINDRGATMLGGTLLGNMACLYVETRYSGRMVDPLTGAVVYPKRFCVALFLTTADRHLDAAVRRQELLGRGASWAEAFARAHARLLSRVA